MSKSQIEQRRKKSEYSFEQKDETSYYISHLFSLTVQISITKLLMVFKIREKYMPTP